MAVVHQRHNHDNRRRPHRVPVDNGPHRPVPVPVDLDNGEDDGSSSYTDTTGTNTTSESVTIPASLIEQQQAAESQNQEYPVAQEVTPPRPLGL